MTQIVTQAGIEATKAVLRKMRGAEGPTKTRSLEHAVPRESWPALRQATFDLKMQEKYNELKNVKIKVKNIHDEEL